ncbi:MAG: porin [Candidatus Puniceispirillales bacterium]
MRKLLLGTTALAAAATLTTNAALADVSIAGMLEWSYNSRSSNIATVDGTTFTQDSDMQISFSNKTDSGLDLGMTVDFDTDGGAFANDETSLSIGGGFGKIVLGYNDAAADSFIIDESDLIQEDEGPVQASATISTSSSMALGQGDNNKIAYFLPAMGGLTAGVSHTDSGAPGTSDSTSMGAKYALEAAGAALTLSYATSTTDNATQDIDSSTMGMKIVSGDISMIISQGTYEASGEDYDNMGASISYKMPNGMTIGAYTFNSEDDADTGEEYSRSGAEVQYTIASGLTAVINVDDYDYKIGTNSGATADSGTNSRLTIKAAF